MKIKAHLIFYSKSSLAGGRKPKFSYLNSANEMRRHLIVYCANFHRYIPNIVKTEALLSFVTKLGLTGDRRLVAFLGIYIFCCWFRLSFRKQRMASDHFGPFRVVLNGSLSVIEGTFQKTVKRSQENSRGFSKCRM